MTEEANTQLVSALKKVGKSPKPYAWYFCMSGSDGTPVLLVGKRDGDIRAEGMNAKKTATDKRDGQGQAKAGPEGLVFGFHEGSAPIKEIQKALNKTLAKDPALKKAKGLLQKAAVVTAEAFAGPSAPSRSAPSEAPIAKQVEDLRLELEGIREEARRAYDAAIERLTGTHPDVIDLAAPQSQAKQARIDGLTALNGGNLEKALTDLTLARDLYEEVRDGALSAGLDDEGLDDVDESVPPPSPTPRPVLRQEVPSNWVAESIETNALFDAMLDVHKDLFDGNPPTALPGISFAIVPTLEIGTIYVKAQVWDEASDGVFDPVKNKDHAEMARDMAPAAVTIVPTKDPARTVYFNQQYMERNGGKPDYDEVNAIMLHESHHAASKGFVNVPFFDDHALSWKLDECVTDWFTKKVWDTKYPDKAEAYLLHTSYFENPGKRTGWFGDITRKLFAVVPEKTLASAYFAGDPAALLEMKSRSTDIQRVLGG